MCQFSSAPFARSNAGRTGVTQNSFGRDIPCEQWSALSAYTFMSTGWLPIVAYCSRHRTVSFSTIAPLSRVPAQCRKTRQICERLVAKKGEDFPNERKTLLTAPAMVNGGLQADAPKVMGPTHTDAVLVCTSGVFPDAEFHISGFRNGVLSRSRKTYT